MSFMFSAPCSVHMSAGGARVENFAPTGVSVYSALKQ